jgi:phosphopantothenoylcysteine decarboxylase/phosphopantothenate--cysteine ligase
VTLLASNLAVPAPDGIEVVQAPTAADVEAEALARADADVIVMAAAVADYRPARARDDKRPKDEQPWQVELEPTVDVARALGERRNGGLLVAFGAEHSESGLARKRDMLDSKNADLVVYNDVGRDDIGFDSDDNEVVLVTRDGERHVPKAPKTQVAAAILDEVERLLGAR